MSAEDIKKSVYQIELRDKIAMAALTGYLAKGADSQFVAEWSYRRADEMMKEREK